MRLAGCRVTYLFFITCRVRCPPSPSAAAASIAVLGLPANLSCHPRRHVQLHHLARLPSPSSASQPRSSASFPPHLPPAQEQFCPAAAQYQGHCQVVSCAQLPPVSSSLEPSLTGTALQFVCAPSLHHQSPATPNTRASAELAPLPPRPWPPPRAMAGQRSPRAPRPTALSTAPSTALQTAISMASPTSPTSPVVLPADKGNREPSWVL